MKYINIVIVSFESRILAGHFVVDWTKNYTKISVANVWFFFFFFLPICPLDILQSALRNTDFKG